MTARGEAGVVGGGSCRWWEGAAAGAALTPTCCSTDQVKGVLTLQGDALSQAVSPPAPAPSHATTAANGQESGVGGGPPALAQFCPQLAV